MTTYESDVTTRRAPPWLRGTWGARFMGVLGYVKDVIVTAAKDAVKVRFLSTAPADALPWHGHERLMPRNPYDTDDVFRARLQTAWSVWEFAGTQTGVLGALLAAGFPSTASWRVTLAPSWIGGDPWPPLLPSPLTSDWSRFWVEVKAPFSGFPWHLVRWNDPGVLYGDGHLWGMGGSIVTIGARSYTLLEQLDTLRSLINHWRPAHERCEHVILRMDDGASGLYPLYVPVTPIVPPGINPLNDLGLLR